MGAGSSFCAAVSLVGANGSFKGAHTAWLYKTRHWGEHEAGMRSYFGEMFRTYGKELRRILLEKVSPSIVLQYDGQINHVFGPTMIRLQHELTDPTISLLRRIGMSAVQNEVSDLSDLVDAVISLWEKKDVTPVGPPSKIDKDELYAAVIADLEREYFSPRGILLTDYENAQVQVRLESIIHTGVEEGWTIRRVAEEIERGIGGMYSGNRAMIIARTEVPALFNRCSYETMVKAECIAAKIWLAVMDERTRDTHIIADGQQVPINEKFRVNGVWMMYPGDPAGGPREVCNCRCAMLPVVASQYIPQNTSTSTILDTLLNE